MKDKIIVKLEIIVIIQGNKDRGAAHRICNLKYSRPKNIPIAFHYWSNYQYHFIMKMLAKEFKKQFIFLGNIDKYLIFTVPMEKIQEYRNGEEITKNISYRSQFIDSARFMKNSSTNVVNNLSEGIHKIKCKYGHNDKKCETWGIIVTTFLNTKTLKMI